MAGGGFGVMLSYASSEVSRVKGLEGVCSGNGANGMSCSHLKGDFYVLVEVMTLNRDLEL